MLLRTDILQKTVVGCPWTALRPIRTRGFAPGACSRLILHVSVHTRSVFKFAQFAPGACSQIFNRLNIVEHFAGWKFCSQRWSIPWNRWYTRRSFAPRACPWSMLREQNPSCVSAFKVFRFFLVLSLCPFFGFFPVLFARALEIPVFYLVYTRLCWVLPFSFPVSFITQLQFVFWLVVWTPYFPHATLFSRVFRRLLVFFFPLAHRFSFPGYSLFYLSLYISCLIAVQYARRVFLIIFWLPLGPDFCLV